MQEKPPVCPNCGAPMHQVRVNPRGNALEERMFECKLCKTTVVQPAQVPIQE
jgi:transposase-like protein